MTVVFYYDERFVVELTEGFEYLCEVIGVNLSSPCGDLPFLGVEDLCNRPVSITDTHCNVCPQDIACLPCVMLSISGQLTSDVRDKLITFEGKSIFDIVSVFETLLELFWIQMKVLKLKR